MNFTINPDIRKAATLPATFYRDPEVFEALREWVFYRTWQWIGDDRGLESAGAVVPFVLLEGFLDEPMVLTRDASGDLHCLSNVCTHRGNLVVGAAGNSRKLICGYHGRRFDLSGAFEHMPEFSQTENFPTACDNLPAFPLRKWGPLLFAGMNPEFDFQEVIDAMKERVGFLPMEQFIEDPSRHKEYYINAHWALYCDNYLEGFHIPFVHDDLNAVLDYGDYETVLYKHMNLQIGYAGDSDMVFDLPPGHPDSGKKVAAYYYWVFPNTMFNFYPWGLSMNLVQPLGPNRTKVSFKSYVYDVSKLDLGAGSGLDKVEMEDEEVVEGVHKGIRSHYYQAGRFSPSREQGVHHFHSLLAEFLSKA
ncbi:aromatic ring-hydroxylating oxygenase subunit alpha [Robiginitalea aurantiaca]|uniref:Aromatic ring-hydroxylating dioxygenase subunit alpha n=1 Tax=Robiginitalea aurantiaca TaxID=3056915 RepID=A0ABT7WBM8_9FLAO|nr:aromatic ring-hydroxylating dioxygenase subunit alpha [Robiginitalea aurantiaca]MDM9630320.1 aromatic ring-hydroxylating dioxygenase subunit alpha [Robiginitalea aurantiaca]